MDEFVGELTCETFHFRTEPCLSDAARKLPGLLLIHSRQPIPPPACIPPVHGLMIHHQDTKRTKSIQCMGSKIISKTLETDARALIS